VKEAAPVASSVMGAPVELPSIRSWTVPVGVGVPAGTGVTVAPITTAEPWAAGFGLTVTATAVLAEPVALAMVN
jgi:hypothetical protein